MDELKKRELIASAKQFVHVNAVRLLALVHSVIYVIQRVLPIAVHKHRAPATPATHADMAEISLTPEQYAALFKRPDGARYLEKVSELKAEIERLINRNETLEAQALVMDGAAREASDLRAKAAVDGPVFNAGRAEGQSDIKVRLRKIVDPHDLRHWNLDGVMTEVERLSAECSAASEALGEPCMSELIAANMSNTLENRVLLMKDKVSKLTAEVAMLRAEPDNLAIVAAESVERHDCVVRELQRQLGTARERVAELEAQG